MTWHEYSMKAAQDDARRAGERDRLRVEARRARGTLGQRLVAAVLVGRGPKASRRRLRMTMMNGKSETGLG
ncbi:MAG: hypothetical protein JO016_14360 [Actinobacteria bacterium]|jgi:hypothetical protein|nr:hypothetical protein [Actinomycetota bacterium]